MKVFLLILLMSMFSTPVDQAYMVWDAHCLFEVSKQPDKYLIAPHVDGQPDMRQARLMATHVTYKPECGQIVIKH